MQPIPPTIQESLEGLLRKLYDAQHHNPLDLMQIERRKQDYVLILCRALIKGYDITDMLWKYKEVID